MIITSAKLGEVGDLALAFGATQRQLGAATFKPVMPGEEWDAKVADDHAAWQAFSDALWALAEGEDSPQLPKESQGQKSTQPGYPPVGAEILSEIGLWMLPAGTVILSKSKDAYQKYGTGAWDGLGRSWDESQVARDLPATLVHFGAQK